ncbi:MAG: aldo/keto reductase [Planctomycetota bacterium]|jgi:aryl-alcohol dehydrogenase-like predicted oxidoreductase
MKEENDCIMNRRDFNKLFAAAAVGGPSFLVTAASASKTATKADEQVRRNERSSMTYRKLGRTNFMSSRLVFGCGAALAGGRGVRLLDRAFEAGINHYDNGTNAVYRGSERTFAPFMKKHRDSIWVASKAPLESGRLGLEDSVTVEQAKTAAKSWTKLLDASLKDLQTEYVDAYYVMGVNNPNLISSEEIYKAFLAAKSAGKVGYFGLSTHQNAGKILAAAIETGWYDVAMVGITPAGWYDWTTKELEKDTPLLKELQPLLKRTRDAGIGLIGMKTARYLAPLSSAGKGNPSAFDKIYSKNLKESALNSFQRAYAYVLEHGLDVVNSDMQNFKHLEQNIIAAATCHTYAD